MSRHGYTVAFFPTLEDLVSTFRSYAVDVERDPQWSTPGRRFGTAFAPEVHTIENWGDSLVGQAALAHAEATEVQDAYLWYSTTDPRDLADDDVTDLVVAIWHRVLAEGRTPQQHVYALPSTFEERPRAIPRVAGVRYFPAVSISATIAVPAGCTMAVAVRDECVADDDWEHICDVADPGHLEPEGAPEPEGVPEVTGLP